MTDSPQHQPERRRPARGGSRTEDRRSRPHAARPGDRPRRPIDRESRFEPRIRRSAARRTADAPSPPAPADPRPEWIEPWVQLRAHTYHPFVYRRMVGRVSPGAAPGDIVNVYGRSGERFGSAFYNPRSEIRLRMLALGESPVDTAFFRNVLARAAALRRDLLKLDEVTDAYRVVHSEGDGLSGLVVDRFADLLSVEVFSLGVHRRVEEWMPFLHAKLGTTRHFVHVDAKVRSREGFDPAPVAPTVRALRIREHGVRFAVDFERGHKTGFFCDQRENRRRFAELARGRSVLDVCCYTGGFAISALVHGGAREVVGVDLDELAIDQARHNANLNQVRAKWVHSDAFSYLRQMQRNGRTFETVVVDPPKFIAGRSEIEEGAKRYRDLNRLALSVTAPGGLFVTCSCSGALDADRFEQLVIGAAHRENRRLQSLGSSGAGADHPVMANCPESQYLKVGWWRVE